MTRTLEARDVELPESFWESSRPWFRTPEHWLDNNPPIVW